MWIKSDILKLVIVYSYKENLIEGLFVLIKEKASDSKRL
jgi:hypothetical protein